MSAPRAMRLAILRRALPALLTLGGAGVAGAAPAISADEIVDIAASGVGSNYVWGGGCWDPNNRGWKGADCSGFVAKALQVPTRSPTTECKHPYVSGDFAASGAHWNKIDRGAMRKADVFGKDGHVILFAGGDGWGASEVYEARGSAYGIVHRTATIGAEYRAVRRTDLVEAPEPEPEPEPEPQPGAGSGLVAQLVGADVVGGLAGDGGVVAACPGQRLQLRVELANAGTATWRDVDGAAAGEAVRLGHRQGQTLGAAPRVSLNETAQATVAPGQRAAFEIPVTVPGTPGVYESAWQLVSELVAWFGPLTTFVVEVTATPADVGQPCTLDAGAIVGSCTTGTWQCGAAGLTCVAPASCGAPGGSTPPGPSGPGIVPDGPASGSAIGSCAVSGAPGAELPLLLLLAALAALTRRRR